MKTILLQSHIITCLISIIILFQTPNNELENNDLIRYLINLAAVVILKWDELITCPPCELPSKPSNQRRS